MLQIKMLNIIADMENFGIIKKLNMKLPCDPAVPF